MEVSVQPVWHDHLSRSGDSGRIWRRLVLCGVPPGTFEVARGISKRPLRRHGRWPSAAACELAGFRIGHFACVCLCVHASTRVCVYVCMRVCAGCMGHVCVCVCVCTLARERAYLHALRTRSALPVRCIACLASCDPESCPYYY